MRVEGLELSFSTDTDRDRLRSLIDNSNVLYFCNVFYNTLPELSKSFGTDFIILIKLMEVSNSFECHS